MNDELKLLNGFRWKKLINDASIRSFDNSRDIIKIYKTISELNSNLLDLLKIVKILEEKIDDNL
tara:strand:+ start:2700 stop:2891 length:192 start_codon:yes stop_codon:yes gene_type:complete